MDGWDTELSWFPRAGSVIYNGEWEWIYGPSALTEGHWPVMERFQKTQARPALRLYLHQKRCEGYICANRDMNDADAGGTRRASAPFPKLSR
jgi:hypothetical protein